MKKLLFISIAVAALLVLALGGWAVRHPAEYVAGNAVIVQRGEPVHLKAQHRSRPAQVPSLQNTPVFQFQGVRGCRSR